MLDEGALLGVAFRRIQRTRMAGMPLLNPALEVEAVGFRDWSGRRVGVLVTPWCINLVLLRARPIRSPALALDQRRRALFPSGSYEFMGGEEPECGPFDFCSLFSPPQEFADQAAARRLRRSDHDAAVRGPRERRRGGRGR